LHEIHYKAFGGQTLLEARRSQRLCAAGKADRRSVNARHLWQQRLIQNRRERIGEAIADIRRSTMAAAAEAAESVDGPPWPGGRSPPRFRNDRRL
jgi:hypothetical protein